MHTKPTLLPRTFIRDMAIIIALAAMPTVPMYIERIANDEQEVVLAIVLQCETDTDCEVR